MSPTLLSGLEIPPLDLAAQIEARRRWDRLTKPQGSLGLLEDLGSRIAAMTGQPVPRIGRKVIFTVAGDHGVTAEGVSAFPSSVTAQMVANFIAGGAGINVLARHAGAEVVVVDAGVAEDLPAADGLISCKVRRGTANMAQEPAMTRSEAEQAVEAGIRVFRQVHASHPVSLIGLGDMGIGNTTASAALTAVLTNRAVEEVTGRGTGLTTERLQRKINVIQAVLFKHRPDPKDPLDCLAKVGGLEIGCLAGITLGAAQARVPVVVDGFITSAAALVACGLAPAVRDYLIASHRSVEPGHTTALNFLKLQPLLELKMRLGEGTGAALGISLVESAVRLLGEMATFDEAGVSERSDEKK